METKLSSHIGSWTSVIIVHQIYLHLRLAFLTENFRGADDDFYFGVEPKVIVATESASVRQGSLQVLLR